MERRQGSLVPIGKASGSLDGPVKALCESSPQMRHHFTRADQVNQLVSANESDPDLGFMARLMTLCCNFQEAASRALGRGLQRDRRSGARSVNHEFRLSNPPKSIKSRRR